MSGSVSSVLSQGGNAANQYYAISKGNKNGIANGLTDKNEAWNAEQNAAKNKAQSKRLAEGCRTCAGRKYKDGSDDPGVSFKSATSVKPESAGAAVMAHEQEHVTREKQRAGQEGREVIAQSVTLHMGICPECQKPFVAGGTTRTTTAAVKNAYKNTARQAPSAGINKTI